MAGIRLMRFAEITLLVVLIAACTARSPTPPSPEPPVYTSEAIPTIHIAEMAGGTVFTAGLTVSFIPATLATCLTPVSCGAGLSIAVPATGVGAVVTYYLAKGTYEVFQEQFIKMTP